jgi:hypothetical protein
MKKLLVILSICFISLNLFSQFVESKFDKYGGHLSLNAKKTGWFHVEKLNNRWYFVTPEGNGFFSLGATHSEECIAQDELNLFETKYNRSEERLSEFFLSNFKKWGYNSSGYGVLPTMKKQIPYVVEVWTEAPRSHSAGASSKNHDIFDPKVQKKLKAVIQEKVNENINNPYCLGYVMVDCPLWSVSPQNGMSYVDFMRSLPSNARGKKEYIKFIKKRYGKDIKRFISDYRININTFTELNDTTVSKKITAKKNPVVAADDELFLNIIAEAYFRFNTQTFKKLDPNHLLLGDRFMAATTQQSNIRTPDIILKTAAKYFDVLSFQPMGAQTMWKDYFNHVAELTNMPILLADVNTTYDRPKQGQTDTQDFEERMGTNMLSYYTNIIDCPALIGIHRCTVRDYRPWDTKFYRRGILKADDTPYPIMEKYTIESSKKVFEVVYP